MCCTSFCWLYTCVSQCPGGSGGGYFQERFDPPVGEMSPLNYDRPYSCSRCLWCGWTQSNNGSIEQRGDHCDAFAGTNAGACMAWNSVVPTSEVDTERDGDRLCYESLLKTTHSTDSLVKQKVFWWFFNFAYKTAGFLMIFFLYILVYSCIFSQAL